MADARMPEVGEVVGRQTTGVLVAHRHVAAGLRVRAVDEHARDVAVVEVVEERHAHARALNHEAVDAVLDDEALVGRLGRLVAGVLGQQHDVAALPGTRRPRCARRAS